ncbi:homeobox protein cut isoform X3 [Homalodisca vitripennis]|uniref:homeobox protein cut isoform X3 n=1 Tax=Homalodisca vitripennis TaxID=197043 RepID=UPI001EEAD23D|nr:homeobox protein cut isoform X3 [Homalodisca vitripennis]
MDIQAMQSMDWLFKKERIYLLAQFWQQRATLAEKEVTALKEQLSASNQSPADKMSGSDDIKRSSAEVELNAKDKEISQLIEDVQRLQSSIGKLQENSANQIARLEEELEHKRQLISRLEARLDAQRDYEDLKRQLSFLKSIELPPNSEGDVKTLESLLLERTKAAQHQAEALKAPPCSTPSDMHGAADMSVDSSGPLLFPAPAPPPSQPSLQNVETFGSFLGEEIVANWRRSLERTILSQGSTPQHLGRVLPPPDGRSSSVGPLAQSPVNATPPPPHTPTQNVDISDDTGKSRFEERERERERERESAERDHEPAVTSSSGSHRPSSSPAVSADLQLNGSSTPCKSPAAESDLGCNNNSPHLNNNNNNMPGSLVNGFCGLNVGLNNNVLHPSSQLNFNDVMKSPFRFDDRPSFRFGSEDPGAIVGRFGESLIPKGDPMEARLQEMLRYNMDKYSTQNLDTLHIARRVRELLSIHNVGQRLFAKYVLGLSQGTVSELLSKPKPWDKLTEKGRDSYRKMHAWACDDNAVMLLKSLIPKKGVGSGKDSGIPAMFARDTGDMTEERIAHILSEASHLMKTEDSHSNDDSRSPTQPQQCSSPPGRGDNSQNRKLKKYENDDIPQEQVVRIYQEELAKLMGRRFEDSMRGEQTYPGLLFPHFFGSGASGPGSAEEIRMALDAYHRELAKLNSQCASVPGANLPGLLALQQQALSQQQVLTGHHNGMSAGSSASSPLGNSILPPEDFSPSAAVSPLQRMASITNALISQPSTPHHHSPSQRPLKAVLPPITQQQFDQFNNLNTEEIVRKVKEQLSQFSISQRLFGESVLGLSQGSVSDLLARPKPWHMLTQKGREPFIRMKMFLEDDNAVHKLVASQYKIAPEKLMRTGGYGINSPGSSISKPLPPSAGKMPPMPPSMDMKPSDMGLNHLNYLHPPQQVPPPPPPPHHIPPPHHLQLNSMEHLKKSHGGPPTMVPQCNTMPPHQVNSVMRNLGQQVAPSVYEMAALTQDLDTQTITTKIKEALLANNIGQKIFGEAVLGLSQGSVSELLSKPKPWHMLSIKGREPFIRMQLWLSDTHNIDRLQAIKSERREMNKRRRGSGQQDNSSDTSSNDTAEFYHSSASSPPSAAKKQRVLFSEEQKEALRLAFALDPYPSLSTIEFLANELTLASRTITNWFHNHRMRLKQQSPHGSDSSQSNRESQGSGFDPNQFRMLLSQRLGLNALPMPFPTPYFPPNPELAALMQRGILPMREQDSGLDLTVKHEAGSDDEDNESRLDSEDSDIGVPELPQAPSGSSRRKPAAPQWVNPDWQEESEVIINGVCVMQTDDYNERERESETVRVEPTAVVEEDEARSSTLTQSLPLPSPCPSDIKQEPVNDDNQKTEQEKTLQTVKEEKWDSEF